MIRVRLRAERRNGFLATLVVLVLLFALAVPGFAAVQNLALLLHTATPLMLVAAGLTFPIVAGRIDISVGSTMFASMAVGASVMASGQLDPLAGAAVALAVGALVGTSHGILVAFVGLDGLILTLGSMIALRGVALAVLGGTVLKVPTIFTDLGQLRVGPLYADSLVGIAVLLACQMLLTRTVFGRGLVGIGNDARVAAQLGFPERARTVQVFALCSIFAAAAGLVSVSQIGAVNTTFGSGMEFLGIAAVVLGGTSLFGGSGSFLPGALTGTGILVVIQNGLTLMAASPYAYPIARGAVIFLAMYVDSLSAVSAGRGARVPSWVRAVAHRTRSSRLEAEEEST